MELSELFKEPGVGVFATADREGVVNTAIYSRPHMENEKTLIWGMAEGRTYANLTQNPNASYLFHAKKGGYNGVRLGLKLLKVESSGPMLDHLKANTTELVGARAGASVAHAVWFTVVEARPLV